MRVVHVIAAARRGGAEQLLWLIGRHLQQTGTACSVVFFDDGPMRERFEEAGLSCHVLGGHGVVRPLAMIWAKRLLATLAPDVVHLHGMRALGHWAPVARVAGIPMVYSTHASASVKDATYGRLAAGYRRLEGVFSRACASAVVATSERMGRDLVDAGGVPSGLIRVIPPCIDLERLRPVTPSSRAAARRRFGLEGHVVGMVGRLIPVKGHAVMFQALRQLPGTTLLLAGEGSERGALDALASRLGIRARVVMLGDTSEVAAVYHASDVVAYPSTEGIIGLAALEAMACGLPVVTSDLPGLEAFVEAGRTALLAPPGDATSLAAMLAALLNDAPRASRLAEAGMAHARATYAPAAAAAAYRALYVSVTSETAASAS